MLFWRMDGGHSGVDLGGAAVESTSFQAYWKGKARYQIPLTANYLTPTGSP